MNLMLCGYLVKVWLWPQWVRAHLTPNSLLHCCSVSQPMYCGCSVALVPTPYVSLQHNVQQWHLAEPPPHLNFLSFSLVLIIQWSVCLSICVEEHIPKTLPPLLCLYPCYLPLCYMTWLTNIMCSVHHITQLAISSKRITNNPWYKWETTASSWRFITLSSIL